MYISIVMFYIQVPEEMFFLFKGIEAEMKLDQCFLFVFFWGGSYLVSPL